MGSSGLPTHIPASDGEHQNSARRYARGLSAPLYIEYETETEALEQATGYNLSGSCSSRNCKAYLISG